MLLGFFAEKPDRADGFRVASLAQGVFSFAGNNCEGERPKAYAPELLAKKRPGLTGDHASSEKLVKVRNGPEWPLMAAVIRL